MSRPYGYLYQVWILLRRLALVILNVSLFGSPSFKYVTFTLWNLLLLHVHLHMKPFKLHIHNQLETMALSVLVVVSLLLVPYADDLRTSANPLPLPVQILLAILILPITFGLLAKILINAWQKHIGPCLGRKRMEQRWIMEKQKNWQHEKHMEYQEQKQANVTI